MDTDLTEEQVHERINSCFGRREVAIFQKSQNEESNRSMRSKIDSYPSLKRIDEDEAAYVVTEIFAIFGDIEYR